MGKRAESTVYSRLNTPHTGYGIDRIPDQLSGYAGSKNICDFICYKYPYIFYIEVKSTIHERFDFSALSEYQRSNLYDKSKI